MPRDAAALAHRTLIRYVPARHAHGSPKSAHLAATTTAAACGYMMGYLSLTRAQVLCDVVRGSAHRKCIRFASDARSASLPLYASSSSTSSHDPDMIIWVYSDATRESGIHLICIMTWFVCGERAGDVILRWAAHAALSQASRYKNTHRHCFSRPRTFGQRAHDVFNA